MPDPLPAGRLTRNGARFPAASQTAKPSVLQADGFAFVPPIRAVFLDGIVGLSNRQVKRSLHNPSPWMRLAKGTARHDEGRVAPAIVGSHQFIICCAQFSRDSFF
jgi:hypothetical protein